MELRRLLLLLLLMCSEEIRGLRVVRHGVWFAVAVLCCAGFNQSVREGEFSQQPQCRAGPGTSDEGRAIDLLPSS
jgi:hypothetical protein